MLPRPQEQDKEQKLMTNKNTVIASIINHVAIVLDASSSMEGLSKAVIQVADKLIADLANLSQQMDQETRVTVYSFADDVTCIIYDKDVLRLPSIREHYKAYGNTALLKATSIAIDDLAMIPTKHGDNSFLLYIITDGEENASDYGYDRFGRWSPRVATREEPLYRETLPGKIAALSDIWTTAVLVPNAQGVFLAKKYGFPASNIAVWDATSSKGVEEVGRTITAATTSYMTSRASGVRGTKNLFTPAVGNLSSTDITAAGLTPLDPSKYVLIPVVKDITIKDFVEECASQYQVGRAYYQLTGSKTPKGKKHIVVQGNKAVAVMDTTTSKVYTGPEARKLVGLPDHDVNVDPSDTKGQYKLFVQSSSVNRNLYAGTKLLLMTG
jgi:hypothetical protein